ncbi:MAG: hypothetical protein JWO45_1936 [Spartobacteria bacterium]|nr:hypothetical protein [Spartobacteria bacterium]
MNYRDGVNRTASKQLPMIDYHYQTVVLDDYRGRCAGKVSPSFRSISTDYFGREARQSFVSEATFFGVIIITTAVPILQSLHAIAHLVRATGVI